MLPTIRSFMTAHRLSDVTVVADAGIRPFAQLRAQFIYDLHHDIPTRDAL
jgi:hypothetical protein